MPTRTIATFEAEDPTALALQALRKDGVAIIKDVLADAYAQFTNRAAGRRGSSSDD